MSSCNLQCKAVFPARALIGHFPLSFPLNAFGMYMGLRTSLLEMVRPRAAHALSSLACVHVLPRLGPMLLARERPKREVRDARLLRGCLSSYAELCTSLGCLMV